ncbi:MAG: XRE family transcriptional regulator, partial [Clostridia bacterium]|nr:XRE family transcriptional regulator [Clostridia bacterium]
VKEKGDIPFITETLSSGEIRNYYEKKDYPKAFYLLAMVDFLSRENELPLCDLYSDMRKQKLSDPIYPKSVLVMAEVMDDDGIIARSFENAIPEFKRFNIVENEVRNVF